METLNLAGKYRLRAEFLDVGAERFQEVLNHVQSNTPFGILRTSEHRKYHPNTYPYKEGSMEAIVPCDVIQPLVQNGLMEEPLDKMNAKDTAWLCDLSWWFIKEFEVSGELLENDEVHLFIEMLDYKADIILNGIPVGHHSNAFYPFDKDIKKFLKKGVNQMVIRLTSGTEDFYIQDSVSYYCATDDGTKNQRAYLRKPQYTFGWDWCPSVSTCGIGGKIELQGKSGAQITAFRADTVSIENKEALLDLFFEIDKVDMVCANDAVLTYEICYLGEKILSGHKELYLSGGLNFIHEHVKVFDAKLWWPNGYGEPNLYSLSACVVCRDVVNKMETVHFGIRTLQMCQEKIDADQRTFEFVINGVPVFCKGGNWVPPDSVYLRITEEKYKRLIDEAEALHFNMLRVWGGGLYAPDCFYEYCSERGIMVMQDFMYSCAYYPDHLEWFKYEASVEAEYQTKRLAHYPCMAVWTGNNEVAESWTDWWQGILHSEYDFGKYIFNYIQPKIVMTNCPNIPYMASCPYFGEFSQNVREGKVEAMSTIPRWGKHANNPLSGDVHAWNYFLNDPDTLYDGETIFETFDRFPARFLSEFGFYGPLGAASMKRALGASELSFTDPAWLFHGEKTEKHQTILKAIRAIFRDTESLTMEEYLLYGGITQGILYAELADAMRIKEYGSGFLIWMFNDAWPETGWTPLDYYLERKISYYYLKRAFAPRRMVLRTGQKGMVLTVMNETDTELKTEISCGSMSFDGVKRTCRTLPLVLEAHKKIRLELPVDEQGQLDFIYAYTNDESFNTCTDLRPYYRRYPLPEAKVQILSEERTEKGMKITVSSQTYVPCAYLVSDYENQNFSDNYFSLLPGEVKTVYTDRFYKEVKICTA
ncbi:glycoside hydrolase family 2 protein [Eisenbergiella sp.]